MKQSKGNDRLGFQLASKLASRIEQKPRIMLDERVKEKRKCGRG